MRRLAQKEAGGRLDSQLGYECRQSPPSPIVDLGDDRTISSGSRRSAKPLIGERDAPP